MIWNCLLISCRNKNKAVDLSLNFRQTGLSSGAKLELFPVSKSPSVVSVALQIDDSSGSGKRLFDKVPSDTTLWRILRKFESSNAENLNFTCRGVAEIANGSSGAGQVVYEMPVVHVVGREASTFVDLQKTLANFGVSGGNVLLKLSFKKTDQPIEVAQREIGQYFKEEETATTDAPPAKEAIARMGSSENSGEDSDPKDASADPGVAVDSSSVVTPSTRPAQAASEEPLLGPNQRPISVYAAPSSDVPKAALQPHNEDDFVPTVAHAKLHQSRLLNNSQNQRLLSDKEAEQAEKEKAARLTTIKTVEIKLRFPDQSHIVVTFNAEETAADFYRFASGVVAANDPFKLVWNDRGPRTIPRDEIGSKKKLIRDLGLTGRVLVNFVWENEASDAARKGATLKPEYLKEAKEIAVPEVPVMEETQDEEVPSTSDKGKGMENIDGGVAGGKKIPKWLSKTLGKK
jgi:tether containing UBX domain for GLUT4